jgi:hypothetical protein
VMIVLDIMFYVGNLFLCSLGGCTGRMQKI